VVEYDNMKSANDFSSHICGKIFKKNDNIVSRKIADELFLVPIKGTLADMQRIFTLNPVAEYIWKELDGKNLNDICTGVTSTFSVKREQAESDICEFVSELLDADLIRE
jgi:hypothetical protein